MQVCTHEIFYNGVVNLNVDAKLIGAVDVWRCKKCGRFYVEDKRFGSTELAPEVGFKEPEPPDAKWAVLVCARPSGIAWQISSVKPGVRIAHKCADELPHELEVTDAFSIAGGIEGSIHKLLLVEDWVNKPIELGYPGEAWV